jgi:hypothetical protein
MVIFELLEAFLHAVGGGGFPDEFHLIAVVLIGIGLVVEQFPEDFLI